VTSLTVVARVVLAAAAAAAVEVERDTTRDGDLFAGMSQVANNVEILLPSLHLSRREDALLILMMMEKLSMAMVLVETPVSENAPRAPGLDAASSL
jgi:hypothetical protein